MSFDLQSLGLGPDNVKLINSLLSTPAGMILATGPTGSGKTTTLYALLKRKISPGINIITIEDPIEYKLKGINQTQVDEEKGYDFPNGLRAIVRQDPDVIMVGEIRDQETAEMAVQSSLTGHLVFSTLHTATAAEAIERIVDVFDGSKQKQVLIQLASVLRGVVAQQLVPAKDGSLVAAREILVNTPAISNLIRENSIAQIVSTIQTGSKDGMITMENSLEKLVKEKLIDEETAAKRTGRQKKI